MFNPVEWGNNGIVDRLKIEGAVSITFSPDLNPSVAIFVPERKASRRAFE